MKSATKVPVRNRNGKENENEGNRFICTCVYCRLYGRTTTRHKCNICGKKIRGIQNMKNHLNSSKLHKKLVLDSENPTRLVDDVSEKNPVEVTVKKEPKRSLRSSVSNQNSELSTLVSLENKEAISVEDEDGGITKRVLRSSVSNNSFEIAGDMKSNAKDVIKSKDKSKKRNTSSLKNNQKRVWRKSRYNNSSSYKVDPVSNDTVKSAESEDKDELQCSECLLIFIGYRSLRIHMQKKHKTDLQKILNETKTDTNIDVKKDIANENTDETIDGNQVTCVCLNCQDGGRWKMNGKQVHMCIMPRCNQEFDDASELIQHLVSHTEKKPFVCNVCGEMFLLVEDIEQHQRIQCRDTTTGQWDVPTLFQLQFMKRLIEIEKVQEPMIVL